MFTGIIEEVGVVASARTNNLIVNASDVLQGLVVGGSIAVNGACLTITSLKANAFSTSLMPETLKRTNLGLLSAGDRVNLERPLSLGGRLGGHLVQGHIDALGRVVSVRADGEARLFSFEAPAESLRYVVEKGFVAIDGISLTVVAKEATSFQVSVIGYTRQHSTLGERRVGDLVNLEVDVIAKYVEQLSQARSQGITVAFLEEQGFLVS